MLLIQNKRLRLLFGALETFSFLTLKLWWKNPDRARNFCGRIFRTYVYLAGADKWQSRSIDEVLPQVWERRIVLEHTPGDGIDTPIAELGCLALITKNLRPAMVFEIGTYRGRTALNFALNSPPECKVYTLDLPPAARTQAAKKANPADAAIIRNADTGLYYRGHELEDKIRQLYGDSMHFDFAPYYGKADLVFIDGAHHAEAVRSDTLNALQMVREGGCVIWHDFGNYGDYNDVTRIVLELLPRTEIIQIENSQLALYRKRGRVTPNAGCR